MDFLSKSKNLIRFYLDAVPFNKIANPDIAELVYFLLENETHTCSPGNIEKVRNGLLKNEKILKITDLGAGSKYTKARYRTVKSIAKTALSPQWQCKILNKLIQYFHCKTIVELGTSLGISAAYMAENLYAGTVYTLEGDANIANMAMQTFAALNLNNIKLVIGDFDITLPVILNNTGSVDFAFIDGNHKHKATLDYFNTLSDKSGKETVMVFDDIYWSKEMKKAWAEIKNDNRVKGSLDFYYFGVIFFNERYAGHYKVIKRSLKPL